MGQPPEFSVAMMFSVPSLNETYLSEWERADTAFDDNAMKWTDKFLDSVLQEDILPSSVADKLNFSDIDEFTDALLDDVGEVMTNNSRIFTCIVFGLLMAVALPVIGVLWCCFCKSRGERSPVKDSDRYVICAQIWTFLVFFVLSLATMVWYVGADAWLGVKVQGLGEALDAAVFDSSLYINNTIVQIEYLSDENYVEFEAGINETIDIGVEAFDLYLKTNILNGAIDLYGVEAVVSATNEAIVFYDAADASLDEYAEEATVLEEEVDALAGGAGQLDQLIAEAAAAGYDVTLINDLKDGLTVDTSSALSAAAVLPPIDDAILGDAIDTLDDLEAELEEAIAAIENFPETFETEYASVLQEDLQAAGDELNDTTADVVAEVRKLSIEYDPERGEELDEDVDKWDELALIVVLIPELVMIVVFCCYLFGIGFGYSGEPGSARRRRGARCLNAGTIVLFVAALFVWLGCAVLFTAGSWAQKLGCETLEDPESSELYEPLEAALNDEIQQELDSPEWENVVFSVPVMLEQCENDTGVWQVLQLYQVYGDDLDQVRDWKTTYDVAGTIEQINEDVEQLLDDIVDDYLVLDAEEQVAIDASYVLLQAAESAVDVIVVDPALVFDSNNYEDFKEEYYQMVESVDTLDPTVVAVVNRTIEAVDTAEEDFDASADAAGNSVDALATSLVYEGAPLSEAVSDADEDIVNATEYLSETGEGRETILLILNGAIDQMVGLTDGYVEFALYEVEQDIGRCLPIYKVYMGVLNMLCYELLDPFNWAWAGMGLLLLLSVPIQALAMWMVSVLQHSAGDGYGKRKRKKGDHEEVAPEKVFESTAAVRSSSSFDADSASSVRNPVFAQEPAESAINAVTASAAAKPYDPADYYPGYAGATAVTAAAVVDKALEKDDEMKKGPYNPAAFAPEYGAGLKSKEDGNSDSGVYDPADYAPEYAPPAGSAGDGDGAYNPGDFSAEYGGGASKGKVMVDAPGRYDPSEYHPSYAPRTADAYEIPDIYRGGDKEVVIKARNNSGT